MGQTLHSNGSLGFRWSLAGISVAAFGNSLLQSAEAEFTGDEAIVKDQNGDSVIWYGYNVRTESTFDYTVTGTGATVSASVTLPSFGTMFAVSDTSGNNPVTASNYIVKSSTLHEANSSEAKVTVKATAYSGITA